MVSYKPPHPPLSTFPSLPIPKSKADTRPITATIGTPIQRIVTTSLPVLLLPRSLLLVMRQRPFLQRRPRNLLDTIQPARPASPSSEGTAPRPARARIQDLDVTQRACRSAPAEGGDSGRATQTGIVVLGDCLSVGIVVGGEVCLASAEGLVGLGL